MIFLADAAVVIADELPSGAWIGGAVILLGAIIRSILSDLTWRNVIAEVRDELKECHDGRAAQSKAHAEERGEWRAERAERDQKIRGLEGEVTLLRQQIHVDRWTQVDPASRARVYDVSTEEEKK